MKSNLLNFCIYTSAILFVGFLGLFAYTWAAYPNRDANRPEDNGCLITIGRSHPLNITNFLSDKTHVYNPSLIHIGLGNRPTKDLGGCRLIFFNQDMPYELNVMFGFTPGDTITNAEGFHRFGITSDSWVHTSSMMGCADNDRTSAKMFFGYGIYYCRISHTINKEQDWWTFTISLWYPIVLTGVLSGIFVMNKLRARKCDSTKN